MAPRIVTSQDIEGIADNVKVLAFSMDDNYTNCRHASDYPHAIVIAKDRDAAIELFCQFADISDWHFYETSCDCCAMVDITVQADHYTAEQMARYVSSSYYTVICG
jgi:hypothetical protein